jgi:hypothetical protein
MKVPQRKVTIRSEDELRELDKIAESVAGFSKSFSASETKKPDLLHKNSILSDDKKGLRVIETQRELEQLSENDFTLNAIQRGRLHKFVRVSINPRLTDVWEMNTRSAEVEPDVSDIIDTIKTNGTNITPAEGYFDPLTRKVTIISGSRRRYATLKSNLFLTMDLYYGNMSDNDKYIRMWVENIRKDPDVFLKCRSICDMHEPSNGLSEFASQQDLADFLNVSRKKINQQLSVGRLPRELVDKINDRKAITHERAFKFSQAFNNLINSSSHQKAKDDIFEFIRTRDSYSFIEISKFVNAVSEPVKAQKTKILRTVANDYRNVFQLSNQSLAIEIPTIDTDKLNDLMKIIEDFMDSAI